MKIKVLLILLLLSNTYSQAYELYSPKELAKMTRQFERQYSQSTTTTRANKNPVYNLIQTSKLNQSAEQEWLLSKQIKALHSATPTAELRTAIEQLSQYTSTTKTWQLDGNYKIDMVAWPIAANARGLLNYWDLKKAEQTAQQNLVSGNWQVVLTSSKNSEQSGFIKAVKSTPVELLSPLINQLLSESRPSHYQQQLIWTLATKTKQFALYNHAISIANRNTAIQIMKQRFALDSLPTDAQITLLKNAVNNPHLSSAAVLQLGRFVDSDSSVADTLIALLSDPQLGGSAARALIHSKSFEVLQQLKRLSLSNSKLEKLRANQVLSLKQQADGGR